MNYALILAAGTGQRMRNGGLPKQFLKLQGKPIIVYTLEKFANMEEIDSIVISCHGAYVDYLNELLEMYRIHKISEVITGGGDRQESLKKGLEAVGRAGATDDDLVLIHDGVRPLVSEITIAENIRIARQTGCVITVHQVTESVVITDTEDAGIDDFKKRSATYSLTSPQTFKYSLIMGAYENPPETEHNGMPLLDAGMMYAAGGNRVSLVKEQNENLKITTPEDFYVLRALLELEENKFIFGL